CFADQRSAANKSRVLINAICHHYEEQIEAMLKKSNHSIDKAALIGEYTAMHVVALLISGVIPKDSKKDYLIEEVILWLSYTPFLKKLIFKTAKDETINVSEYYLRAGIRFMENEKDDDPVVSSMFDDSECSPQIYHCNASSQDHSQAKTPAKLEKNIAQYGSRWATPQEIRLLMQQWNALATSPPHSDSRILQRNTLIFDQAVLRSIPKSSMPLQTKLSDYQTPGQQLKVHERKLEAHGKDIATVKTGLTEVRKEIVVEIAALRTELATETLQRKAAQGQVTVLTKALTKSQTKIGRLQQEHKWLLQQLTASGVIPPIPQNIPQTSQPESQPADHTPSAATQNSTDESAAAEPHYSRQPARGSVVNAAGLFSTARDSQASPIPLSSANDHLVRSRSNSNTS
ncbi:MAG: hypothetical protein ACD_45C00219G0001, partial [uncultured bacterium]